MTDLPAPARAPGIDMDEIARLRRRRAERMGAWALPVVVVALTLGGWEALVRAYAIPHYILPGPMLVAETLVEDWGTLWPSLLVTLQVTALALLTAVVLGAGLGVLFSLSRWLEMSLYPYAVTLQVMPVVAIAPLILIYVESKILALVVCAWIVAFFPILSSTTLGLRSTDRGLSDLHRIYGASPWQRLWLLQVPSAMPYFLGGLRIAGGLALIGTIVAEYVAGTAGTGAGLAFRILEAGYRLNIPRMFAALALIALTGIAIYAATSLLSHLVLRRWHESAMGRER